MIETSEALATSAIPPTAQASTATPAAIPATTALPDSVQWAEGMLLSPQHFQKNDAYWQEHLRFRLARVVPDYWGLGLLELDMTKLRNGTVAIKRLECVMPDGTPVIFPGSYGGKALELDVNAQLKKMPSGVRLSLIMPARNPASNHWNASPPRYELVPGLVAIDENTLTGSVPVDRLRPSISLSAEAAISAQYVVCPLFEILRRDDTRSVEFKSYHPPMLCWQACDFLRGVSLQQRLQLVNEALWLKLRELGANRRDDAPEDDRLQSADVRKHLEMARHLAAVLPHFSLMVQRAESGPRAIYDSLAVLLGAMASFGANPIPPVLDAYQHDNCEPQFRRAMDYVVRKLGYINTSFEYQAFEHRLDGSFARVLPKELGSELIVELRLQDGQSISQGDRVAMERWLQDACIASEELQATAARLRVTARPRMLNADELIRRNFSTSAALFVIENESLELQESGSVKLFGPQQKLVINGHAKSVGCKPAMVLLYQSRKAGTGTTA
jgi:type VI secretion system protein ImpJ